MKKKKKLNRQKAQSAIKKFKKSQLDQQ